MKRVLLAIVFLAFAYLYYLQFEFGVQIPKLNSVTGDACGIVIFNNTVLDFSNWDPNLIDGYPDMEEIPVIYQVSKDWGGTYTNPDGSTGFGFGFLDGYCFVESGKVTYLGSFTSALYQEPRYKLPFALP